MDAKIRYFEELLREVNEFLKKGDPMQASEKLYKIAEDSIKLLAKGNIKKLWKVKDGILAYILVRLKSKSIKKYK